MTDSRRPNPSDPESNSVALAKAAKDMRENMLAIIEYNVIKAKVTRAKYLALLSEGFTRDEAIVLCKD